MRSVILPHRVGACLLVAIVLDFSLFAGHAAAGVVTIGSIVPTGHSGDYTYGIAFDGSPGAIVIDGFTSTLIRVSTSNAAVLSSSATTPISPQNNALAYDSTTSDFYADENGTQLVRIHNGAFTATSIGSGYGRQFNFSSMAVDPSGNLWLATDSANGEAGGAGDNGLFQISKQTGIATLHAIINLPAGNQVEALAIDGSDRFFIYSAVGALNGGPTPSFFYQVNPVTGSATQLSQALVNTAPVISSINGMAYDPLTQNIYGIEHTLIFPNGGTSFTLVKITGLPEPGAPCLLLIAGVFGALLRRTRPSAATAPVSGQ